MSAAKKIPVPAEPAHPQPGADPKYVVGIGASAGGLEALRAFFSAMPPDTGMAFVVIQHLAPDYKSLMVELLARMTDMPVRRAEEGMKVTANTIYLIPPRYNLTISGGALHLHPPQAGKTLNLPIDLFFRSLAAECGERAVAIVLSGTGSDGARGIRAVKEAGGMVMVQAETSAKFPGMPSSAIATGTADFVLPVEEMPAQLVGFASHPLASLPRQPSTHLPGDPSTLERICQRLREVAGIDFALYKEATLARRIERRMNISQLHTLDDYLQYLLQSPVESEALAKDLLISVTKFFRDAEAFAAVERELPALFEQARPRRVLRIWCAGCATGEEAYSLAMLCEKMRQSRFPDMDLKVFATDLDRAALDIAGAGLYPRSLVADIPPDLMEMFLVAEAGDQYRFSRTLRDRLIFARQDLLSDPPFTKIDLISCRNLLIYLRPAAQKKLISLLHFALQPGGLLFLGSSETLGEIGYAFDTVDTKARLYKKSPGNVLRSTEAVVSALEIPPRTDPRQEQEPGGRTTVRKSRLVELIKDNLLQKFAPATIVTTEGWQVLYTLGDVNKYIELAPGPARLDLMQMLPRELALAVTSAGAQATREKSPVEFRSVRFTARDGAPRTVRLKIEPLSVKSDEGPLLLTTLVDESPPLGENRTVHHFNPDQRLLERVAELEKEIQSTRDSLQASIEQQETANEELQAANEELLAANEELQSTNEELESVNEELYTVNAEYQTKIQELTEANDDIENLTRSTDIGVVFLDSETRIRRFTPAFGRVTGLVQQDVGRQAATFAHPVMLAILAALPRLKRPSDLHEEVLRVGEAGEFLFRVQRYRHEHSGIEGFVASLVDISRLRDTERELAATLETVNVGICVTDEHGRFVQVNPAYCRIYGYSREELLGQNFTIVVPAAFRESAQRLHDEFIRTGQEIPAEWDVVDKHGRTLRVEVRASLLERTDGSRRKITVVSPLRQAPATAQSTPAPTPTSPGPAP